MPDKKTEKKTPPKGYPARAAERFKKKRSIIMDTLFGTDEEEKSADPDKVKEGSESLFEGAKRFIFGAERVTGEAAGKKPEEKKKAKKAY